ncbi:hypothetical protein NDN08_004938 [Rhodosorus marinus]|uniref:Carotenoid oxygenase n=1 Tax=Rhodosorus marinus TaxID=101924 RepID=A0AAV8UHS8_9RHOD|nr:hypothetical protein NDN08_004938 [Rhodosorus marinus]
MDRKSERVCFLPAMPVGNGKFMGRSFVASRKTGQTRGGGLGPVRMQMEPGMMSFNGAELDEEAQSIYMGYNWAPVKKEFILCELKGKQYGKIPKEFPSGMYLRNGPNPLRDPDNQYGWFDGSGMIHSVRFQEDEDGVQRAYYTNRWVKTGFIKISDLLQRPPLNVTVQKGILGLFKVLLNLLRVVRFDAQEYRYDNYALLGTANTAVSYFPLNDGNGKRNAILALYDSDAPYEIKLTKARDPIVQHTLGTGIYNPYGLDHPMTPHPRYSPQTKEMISFGVGMDFARIIRKSTPVLFINSEGKIYRSTEVRTRTSVYQHDFVVTRNFVIMQDNPNTVNPFRMLLNPFAGTPISWKEGKRTSFVMLPRTSPDNPEKSEGAKILHGDETLVDKTKEFFLPKGEECFVFHYANGWEEGDNKVVFYGTHHAKLNLVRFNSKYPPPKDLLPKFYRFELDLTTGTASKQLVFGSEDALVTKLPDHVDCPIDDLVVDFCNASFEKSGEKSEFLYMCYTKAVVNGDELISPDDINKGWSLGFWQGVIKLNTATHEVQAITYPRLMNGGEAIFQPKVNAQSEDDGYLISHVTALEPADEEGGEAEYKSYIALMDAKNMSDTKSTDAEFADGFIYCAQLPARVPWGLHGLFLSDEFMCNESDLPEEYME